MKLLRYGEPGRERPAAVAADGSIRDLGTLWEDIGPAQLGLLAEGVPSIDLLRLPVVPASERLGPPVASVPKFVAIGLNYHDHALESGQPVPKEPVVFSKWTSCIGGPNDDIVVPPESTMLDWEVELGIVIGRRASRVGEAEALSRVAGYVLLNDVSERAFQLFHDGKQWDKGKGFDTFGPIGPWLVTRDEVEDPQNLCLWLKVNGELKQSGSTSKMIFSCAQLVSYCSRIMTLVPGDVIATGTPAGVGLGFKPPQFLKAGDVVELGVDHLGVQRQRVRAG
jgi:2-keto-4-pentenoate hydratase/2-oxohepta-3-ene-1,7-dioic acid hydratase in catechol pathway